MPSVPDPIQRFTCRVCQQETGHVSLAAGRVDGSEKRVKSGDNTFYVRSYQLFNVLHCRDCKSTTYCLDTRVFPNPKLLRLTCDHHREYFPPLPVRKKPDWFGCLQVGYQAVLGEVYQAIDNSLFFLASAGTRTAVDQLIVEKIGDAGSFKHKIQKLVERKIIDETDGDILVALIDAGSASTHRSFKPTLKNMNDMMAILEAIFYKSLIEPERRKELTRQAAELRQATPPRKPAS